MPKSVTFTSPPPPTSTLPGLTSRCTTPGWARQPAPWRQPALAGNQLGQALTRHLLHHQVVLLGVEPLSNTATMLGWRNLAAVRAAQQNRSTTKDPGHRRAEHLDRHLPPQQPVLGQVHPGHPADPPHRAQLVAAVKDPSPQAHQTHTPPGNGQPHQTAHPRPPPAATRQPRAAPRLATRATHTGLLPLKVLAVRWLARAGCSRRPHRPPARTRTTAPNPDLSRVLPRARWSCFLVKPGSVGSSMSTDELHERVSAPHAWSHPLTGQEQREPQDDHQGGQLIEHCGSSCVVQPRPAGQLAIHLRRPLADAQAGWLGQ
jgi:hypothetical protein